MMNASDFLIKVTDTIANPACSSGDIQVLIKQIMDRFYSLKPGETLLLPGGWYAEDSGHAMIYEFTRGKDNCTFTVYNSGAGLNYHARQSGQDKELYNPTKSWSIPYRVEDFQEIAHFIARLIDARLKTPVKPRTQPMDEKFLYETILPSIAHVNHKVKEINTSDKLPDHVWTAGQLSGSCPQRVLHQMLKVKSASAQSYPRFMFDFRIYALNDYTGPFLKGAKPLTQAAAKQIHLAIDTNLKILNTEHNFSKEEKQACLKQLRDLRERLNECVQSPIRIHLPNTEKPSTFPTFSKTYAGAPMCQAVITAKNKRAQPKPFFPEFFNIGEDSPLNIILSDVVQSCKNIKDPELQYEYLEKLILSLPLNKNAQFKDSIYKKLQSAENHFDFQQALIALVEILNGMQAKGYTGRTASFNILKFSLLSLLTDSQTVLTGLNKLPSYDAFTNQLMVSLVANHDRNAFLATHNPQLDQRFAELQQRYPQPDDNIKIEELYRFLNSTLQTEPEMSIWPWSSYSVWHPQGKRLTCSPSFKIRCETKAYTPSLTCQ